MQLMERALALSPDNIELLRGIIGAAVETFHPHIGLRFAERLWQLTPDDPLAAIMLGTFQGLNDRTEDAKRTLQQAARLARRQGKRDLEQEAMQLRRSVDTPMFGAVMSMAPLLDPAGEFADDEADDEFLDELLRPPRRRR